MRTDTALFVVCRKCGHRKSAFLALRYSNLLRTPGRPSESQLRPLVRRFKCSQCGAKAIQIDAREAQQSSQYVATTRSADLVFHRPACGWMRHVPRESEIIFPNRETATKQGYSPCRSCRP